MKYFLCIVVSSLIGLYGCNSKPKSSDKNSEVYIINHVLSDKLLDEAPMSHGKVGQLKVLLVDRVLIKRVASITTGQPMGTSAKYFGRENISVCWFALGAGIKSSHRFWREKVSKRHGSVLVYESEPNDPMEVDQRPWKYDNLTGDFYAYMHLRPNAKDKQWLEHGPHYLQASWPRWAKDACPDLPIPEDYPINEKQTAVDFDLMEVQDPNARLTGLLSE